MFISFYPKDVFPTVCLFLKEPFHHAGWELTVEDYDEETEDYQAEADVDEELEEEEEEEEEVGGFSPAHCPCSRHWKRTYPEW